MKRSGSIKIPKVDDRIEIKIKQSDGRRKENRIVRGIIIEEYKEHVLLLNEKTQVRESFMIKDFKNNEINFTYII